ncbi:SDR family oxidoreductase [Rheinheimera sp. UJ51]|uniref:UDP-glucose 4-epimerase family protein n=1 Tax=Rheinheimera sp. UJ51 TaxID=2892446 RepID=UPI001E425D80|nr:SDR family oxidoreductase [Rheinheimera sp. UJ51]MCC5450249.1 SDR family oxidoreductase [Rheinheimera sp. UJ51]
MTVINKILITGATGFIGRELAKKLVKTYSVVALVRSMPITPVPSVNYVQLSNFEDLAADDVSIQDIDVVIHIAAKAHLQGVSLAEFRVANTELSINLARAAAKNGVKRFIFLSSIGVNGVSSQTPFHIDDLSSPTEEYAISKFEAEVALKAIAAETGMEVVIIRPPLVYGKNAPGNFGKLTKLVEQNWLVPLGAINNKRSLVALDNLVDLINTCISHPKAANQTFLVSDDHDLSTTELVKLMRDAIGRGPVLLPVPTPLLKFTAKLLGKKNLIDRLCGNLQVDITHTKQTLGWSPKVTVEEGIKRCFEKEDIC